MKFSGFILVFFISGILLGFYSSVFLNKRYQNHEEFVQKYLQSIEETFELQVLEVVGMAEFSYSEKDQHFLSNFTNPLFAKEYRFYVPFQAEYGVNLKNSKFLKFFNSKIYVELPKAELMSFDLQLPKKKIISKEGWLVFQSDNKFLEFEKKLFEKQKSELIKNKEFQEKAQNEAKNKVLELLEPLKLPVEFRYVSSD